MMEVNFQSNDFRRTPGNFLEFLEMMEENLQSDDFLRITSDNYMAYAKTSCKSYVSALMTLQLLAYWHASWHTGMHHWRCTNDNYIAYVKTSYKLCIFA